VQQIPDPVFSQYIFFSFLQRKLHKHECFSFISRSTFRFNTTSFFKILQYDNEEIFWAYFSRLFLEFALFIVEIFLVIVTTADLVEAFSESNITEVLTQKKNTMRNIYFVLFILYE
jgi:hypothetical protein